MNLIIERKNARCHYVQPLLLVEGVDADHLPDSAWVGSTTVDESGADDYLALPKEYIVQLLEW